MEKKWLAIPAALALTLTLASCGHRADVNGINRTAFDNDGMNGVTPRSFNARTAARGQDGVFFNDGRYVAYPDGTVSPGHGTLARDVNRLARDAEIGAAGAAVGARTALDRLGRDIHDSTETLR